MGDEAYIMYCTFFVSRILACVCNLTVLVGNKFLLVLQQACIEDAHPRPRGLGFRNNVSPMEGERMEQCRMKVAEVEQEASSEKTMQL